VLLPASPQSRMAPAEPALDRPKGGFAPLSAVVARL